MTHRAARWLRRRRIRSVSRENKIRRQSANIRRTAGSLCPDRQTSHKNEGLCGARGRASPGGGSTRDQATRRARGSGGATDRCPGGYPPRGARGPEAMSDRPRGGEWRPGWPEPPERRASRRPGRPEASGRAGIASGPGAERRKRDAGQVPSPTAPRPRSCPSWAPSSTARDTRRKSTHRTRLSRRDRARPPAWLRGTSTPPCPRR